MLNIFISGVTGRVGRILLTKIIQEPSLGIAGGSSNATNESIGKDLGIYNGTEALGVNITDALESKENIDAIIDFSESKNSIKLLRFASENNIPTLVGTTGFAKSELEELVELANHFPLLIAPSSTMSWSPVKSPNTFPVLQIRRPQVASIFPITSPKIITRFAMILALILLSKPTKTSPWEFISPPSKEPSIRTDCCV